MKICCVIRQQIIFKLHSSHRGFHIHCMWPWFSYWLQVQCGESYNYTWSPANLFFPKRKGRGGGSCFIQPWLVLTETSSQPVCAPTVRERAGQHAWEAKPRAQIKTCEASCCEVKLKPFSPAVTFDFINSWLCITLHIKRGRVTGSTERWLILPKRNRTCTNHLSLLFPL